METSEEICSSYAEKLWSGEENNGEIYSGGMSLYHPSLCRTPRYKYEYFELKTNTKKNIVIQNIIYIFFSFAESYKTAYGV